LEERQIRLKWDRKKVKISPSEDSIASLLSEFGIVQSVEFLGKKGNQALVTFQDPSSCQPCVDAFLQSKEMRAKYVFVGSQNERMEEQEDDDEDINHNKKQEDEVEPISSNKGSRRTNRDNESLEEWRIRQAAEREGLLREMQLDDIDQESTMTTSVNPTNGPVLKQRDQKQPKSSNRERRGSSTLPFPLPFPDSDDLHDMTPYEKLCATEGILLENLLTSD